MASSATPPSLSVAGLAWSAMTSCVPDAAAPSTVCGSTAVGDPLGSSPRWPVIPATPDQSSSAGMSEASLQSWSTGSGWGAESAETVDTVGATAAATAPARTATVPTKAMDRPGRFMRPPRSS
jgi:hypothetical protein